MRWRRYDKMRFAFRLLNLGWPEGARRAASIANLASDPFHQYVAQLEIFRPHQKRRLLSPEFMAEFKDYDDYWHFRRYWHDELNPLDRAQYVDLKTYLPDDILTKVDRASMATGLEVRPPLLDHVLVETVFGIPARYRASVGNLKQLFKIAVRDLLPPTILTRAKKGFSVPWDAWMSDEREWVQQQLRVTMKSRAFDATASADLVAPGDQAWSLLVLGEWASQQGVAWSSS
jgi:asparagine synthetase B (glutamine-hydrolysing)